MSADTDKMAAELRLVVDEFRSLMVGLPPDLRIELRQHLMAGYCDHCGVETNGRTCHCENDE